MKTKAISLIIIMSAFISMSMAQTKPSCDGSGALTISSTIVTKPKCDGSSDGSINLSVSGPGGASYTYTLTGAASNPPDPAITNSSSYNFSDLEAIGFYVLEVRTPINPADPNTNYYSCVQIINMAPTPALVVSGGTKDPVCAQGDNGSINLSIANGTAPYQITWSDGGDGKSRNDLPKGNYTANIVDANGCKASQSFTINDPPPISLTPTTSKITCNGENDGSVSFSASGGTAPYSYSSDAGGSGKSHSNLEPGTYSVTVKDAKSCETSASFTITEPPVLSATVAPIPPLKCNGDKDRTITINGTGGTPEYTYTMEGTNNSGSGTGASFENNGEGSGTILVEDANGCKASIAYSISGPPPAEFPLSMVKDDCSTGVGSIKSFTPASGGNGGPYTYEYSANGGPATSFTPPHDFAATDGITTAGESVSVKITDKDGCIYNFGSTIENLPRAVPYIKINRNPCIGDATGSILVDSVKKNASVPAYTFFLAKDDGNKNFESQAGSGPKGQSATFNSLGTGGYIMEIEDGKPCGPYPVSEFYLWTGNSYQLVSAGSLYTRDDGTGKDTVSAGSVKSPDHAVMQVIEPDKFEMSIVSNASDIHEINGLIWVYDIKGGTPKIISGKPAYQISIDDPDNFHYYVPKDTTIKNDTVHLYNRFGYFAPGKHTLYIKDALGCMDTILVMVTGYFFIPNLITPNGDGQNDAFEIVSLPHQSTLHVLNRWGDSVYSSTNYNNTFAATDLSDGVYYYELILNSGQRFKGWVEVIR